MAGVCAGTILHFLMSLHQYVWLTIKCRGWFLFRYQRSVGTAWVVILRGSALCARGNQQTQQGRWLSLTAGQADSVGV